MMAAKQGRAVLRADYTPSSYLIDTTELHFEVFDDHVLVHSNLGMRRREGVAAGTPLSFVGAELVTQRIAVAGKPVAPLEETADALVLPAPEAAAFSVELSVRIDPDANTALSGLYRSGKLLGTQCEPEGFRRITWYLDRPDVLSRFRVTIDAARDRYPVLLSNGNPIERAELGEGRHRVVWEDPFPKPSYLFALIAGDLAHIEDEFVTMSGRPVALQIYSEPEVATRLQHAMDSLKRAMRWDEEYYGREYDLDIFMIAALSDFNMGAMENKGLNIFNASALLASPDTATDAAYQRIDSIVAHEYFHNWSGDRVTCRDWFQLSLKEGFTVYRDQEYSATMGSPTVQRIQDVSRLRNLQFAEDAGPMAHSVRPDSYQEIANFYTLTVYEKGAEVIRMQCKLLGAEGFRRGSDLYFSRHDGQAVTCDDFVRAMEDANGVDFTQFKRWYSQSGTPRVKVRSEYDAASLTYTLHCEQSCPATPGQAHKEPFVIPLEVALFDAAGKPVALPAADGSTATSRVLVLDAAQCSFSFPNISAALVPSLLRGFSAPVVLDYDYSRADLAFLLQHETDGFNRWEAGQRLAVSVLQEVMAGGAETPLDATFLASLEAVLADETLDSALCAEMLALPTEQYLAGLASVIDPDAIRNARNVVRAGITRVLGGKMLQRYRALRAESARHAFVADGEQIARRSLQGVLLSYLVLLGSEEVLEACVGQYRAADNLTERLAALACVVNAPADTPAWNASRSELLADFYTRNRSVAQVIDTWFSVQAGSTREGTLERVQALLAHPDFTLRNPNRARSLIAVFCQNLAGFHRKDGAGYRFLTEQVKAANKLNPQLASRLVSPLSQWRRYDEARQQLMKGCLEEIANMPGVSPDVFEIVSKSLA
jgi:aminopeptidase N